MKRLLTILSAVGIALAGSAQVVFKTIVTQGPVIAGEPFQVQYVLEDIASSDEFFKPDFKGFRFVSGPYTYGGSTYGSDGPKKLKNIVFTLVAPKAGKFIVPGADARINGELVKSDNAFVEVIAKTDAIQRGILPVLTERNTDYFLRPGEDAQQKIRENLFVKVTVDKRSCFVGEPVVATFKLYSRLESRSDIVKNPGFYGFTVHDMIALNDRVASTETIAGKKFDVHTVRKVQLYPLQAGLFTIDAMEVQNKVEFSRTAVNKKTEQEIVEGVFEEADGSFKANTVMVESSMHSEPVAIDVKPAPARMRPESFNGATGRFKVDANVKASELARNEEGSLVIRLSGKGNFSQLAAPVITWPKGIEGFEPEIKDAFDVTQVPMQGEKEFRYRFVSTKPGNYELPAVSFSFFDPDSNKYKTVSTQNIPITVTRQEITRTIDSPEIDTKSETKGSNIKWLIAGLALVLVLAGFIKFVRRKTFKVAEPVQEKSDISTIIAQQLHPARVLTGAGDAAFYTALRKGIWDFFTSNFGLSGSGMNKQSLRLAMQKNKIDNKDQLAIVEVLEQCETGVFTGAIAAVDKQELLEKTKTTLERIAQQAQL